MKWNEVSLGDVCEIVSGSTPSTSVEQFWNGNLNWVTPAELNEETKIVCTTERKITPKAVSKHAMRLIPKGTVLLSSRAPIGKVAISGVDMYCNQGFKNLICSDKVYNEYLFWILKQMTGYLNSKGRGATFKELSKEIVANVKIPLPPLAEQRRIAAILDKADAICRKRQEALKLADAFVKSVFLDMFGDPVLNPKGWKKGTIRDVVQEVNYGTSKPAVENGKHIYLRMNNIKYEGHLDLENLKYIDMDEKEFSKYSVQKGDILFNRTNSKELVGKTCVFSEDVPMVIAGYIIRVRVKDSHHPEYVSAVLNSGYGKSTLFSMCKSIVGQANINAQELQKIKLLLPPLPLQNRFAKIVQRVEAHKQRLKAHLAEAEQMKKALQQQFFG